MVQTFLPAALCVLASSDVDRTPPSPGLLKNYETASRTVGRDPEANLRLALWCEKNGLTPEREKHLAMVILADPDNGAARGLLGQVHEDHKWRRPAAVVERFQNDPAMAAKLQAYAARRATTPDTADAQWKLGLWCEKNALKREATAHFVAVLRHDPNDERARKRLGYKKYGSHWATDEQIELEKSEDEARKKADIHWTRILESDRTKLARSSQREEAEKRLASISDPRAVPSILHVFGRSNQRLAGQLLGQIDSPDATRALALLAVHARGAETRRIASETLIRRDPREFVGLLISLVQETTTYQVNAESSQNAPGELVVDGPSATLHRYYRPTPVPQIPLLPGDFLQYDLYGLPVISRYAGFSQWTVPLSSGNFATVKEFLQSQDHVRQEAEASFFASNSSLMNTSQGAAVAQAGIALADQQAGGVISDALSQIKARGGVAAVGNRPVEWATASTIQTQYRELIPIGQMIVAARMANEQLHAKMVADAMQIDLTNASIAQANGRVLPILQATTGQDFGSDQKAWSSWWADNLGYSQSQSPTKPEYYDVIQASAPAISPALTSSTSSINSSTVRIGHSCFGRGTPVRTLTGTKPIEMLEIGDLVLSNDTTSGNLSYQPIVAVHHNPPAATFKVDLGTDSIIATGIHRLWKAGQGWVMTRDLKPGDPLRTVEGTAVVRSVTAEKVQPVFNLEVAQGHDFYVGTRGVLAHDNSLIRPVSDPFDAPAVSMSSTE